MSKILVFDIDGTLLNSSHQINKSTFVAIKYAKSLGVKIIFCSGRPYFDMEHIQTQYQIADYMVCNNGAYWYDVKHNKFYFKKIIDKEIALQAIQYGQEFCALLALHTEKATYRTKLCDEKIMPNWFKDALQEEKIMFFDRYNFSLSKILQKLETYKIMQVAFRLDKEGAKQLAKTMKNNFGKKVDIYIANEVYVDLNPRDVNKFTGLQNLCQTLNYDIKHLVAFGDSGNDLQMLKYVGHGICMGNGTNEAKKAAKEVIGDNDSNAIADKIYELMNEMFT